MVVYCPKEIDEAFLKCRNYLKPGPILDPNAPEDVKEAFKIWIEWENKFKDFR